MKIASTEESIESFVQDVLKPYRKLSIHLAEQSPYSDHFSADYDEKIDCLVHLKKTALGLICRQDCKVSIEADRLNKCIDLFVEAIDLQAQRLLHMKKAHGRFNGSERDYQEQSQRFLTAMSTQLAALKKDIKKEGNPSN
ncbi:hypothetical protein NE619_02280 [Anaerovorax odorimutans]|uniref:Uncharacterized protein n=1 Tax=Anaerovorax odorimutans TaxID=109327 RepID=A0ABT1RK46_9FIRM|nr:hypothetical protein [Anaerovorax odorimutans]MCQ4635544.1 hypothetical protein [Anaerovorax odorimutans]